MSTILRTAWQHITARRMRVAGALIALIVVGQSQAAFADAQVMRLDVFDQTLAKNTVPAGWRFFRFNPLAGLNDRSGFWFVSGEGPDGPYIRLRSAGRMGYGLAAERPFRRLVTAPRVRAHATANRWRRARARTG